MQLHYLLYMINHATFIRQGSSHAAGSRPERRRRCTLTGNGNFMVHGVYRICGAREGWWVVGQRTCSHALALRNNSARSHYHFYNSIIASAHTSLRHVLKL